MSKKFRITVNVTADIELEEAVIDAVDDEWRSIFYPLHRPEDIAGHVGYNMIVNRWGLSSLDGWADQPDKNAQFITHPEGEVVHVIRIG